jgi:hypothetical protein
LHEESVITRTVRAAPGVLGPGHLEELTQTIDFALVDAVLEETRTQERRLRLLPSRVVVYFVLALALFERCSYQAVWGKLTAGLGGLCLARPAASSLCRRLFETLAGPVGLPGQAGVFYRGLRTVAVDGTHLHVPDDPAITWRYPKRAGERLEFGYPLLRLLALIECGTRAVLAAAFGPDTAGELARAGTLLNALAATMLLLADAGFDAAEFLREVHRADRLGRHPDPAGRLRQRLWPRGARPVREHRPGVGLPAVRAVVRRGRPAHVPKRLGRHERRGATVQRLDRGHRVLPGAPDRAVEPERVLLRRGCEQPGHAAQPGGHRQRQHLLHGNPGQLYNEATGLGVPNLAKFAADLAR